MTARPYGALNIEQRLFNVHLQYIGDVYFRFLIVWDYFLFVGYIRHQAHQVTSSICKADYVRGK